MLQILYSVNIKYLYKLIDKCDQIYNLNSSSFSINSRWNQVMNQFMSLMLPSFEIKNNKYRQTI